MTQIQDPADRLDDAFVLALRDRYEAALPPLPSAGVEEFSVRFANVCDLVVQLLWAEKYGTGPDDPMFHTSDPARRIAALVMIAAGIEPVDGD